MKLTLHYKNESHSNKFVTTETFHGTKAQLKPVVHACGKTIVKAYINGKPINVKTFWEEEL